jgi:hypothetical protein
MGHYCGKYGFDMLTHAKSMLISPPDVAIEHLFPPNSQEKMPSSSSGSNIELGLESSKRKERGRR